MSVYVNGLDSLAVDHHWQALSAVLLSPRGIQQPTTAENDAGRGADTLEKIPARVHVRLPVDHFDRTSRTARDVIRNLAISFVCPNKFKASQRMASSAIWLERARGGAARSHAGRASSGPLGLPPKCRSPEKRHPGRSPMRKSCVAVAAIALVTGITTACADPP